MGVFSREAYLELRNSENITKIVYTVYTDIYREPGKKPFPIEKFVFFFNFWNNKSFVIDSILQHYDELFTVLEVSLKGKIIMYL